MISRQEAFDKVWRHFVVEKGPPSAGLRDGTSVCLYRGSGGRRCAIGVLVPDELYDPEWEETTITPRILALTGLDPDADLTFARELQRCHDDTAFMKNGVHSAIERQLREFAEKSRLEVPS